jgi:hypothetical protein
VATGRDRLREAVEDVELGGDHPASLEDFVERRRRQVLSPIGPR